MPRKRGLSIAVPMSHPMEVARSHLDQLEELEQPLEGPKPPPPTIDKPTLSVRPQPRSAPDEDPYKPEKYEVEIFRLMEETIDGKTKPSRFTVLDNAIDVSGSSSMCMSTRCILYSIASRMGIAAARVLSHMDRSRVSYECPAKKPNRC